MPDFQRSPVTTAHIVADYFVAFSHEHGDPVSNLKLQKLLYYAQAWHLVLHGDPLFADSIQAWVHGPVVPSVYQWYKGWAWNPIDENPPQPDLTQAIRNHLNEVLSTYGTMTADALESLIHQEPPWRNARRGLPLDEPSTAAISLDDMRTFCSSQMTG